MIFLDIKDYCHKCNHFEADVEKPIAVFSPIGKVTYIGDATIRCKHRDICERMRIQFSHPSEEELE